MGVRCSFAVLTIFALFSRSHAQSNDRTEFSAKYLKRTVAKKPFPSTVHLRLELTNPTDRLVWFATPFVAKAPFPEDGKCKADANEGFPFSCVRFDGESKQGKGTAFLVGFLGFERFSAFALPARSKVVIEDFEFAAEELPTFDVWEVADMRVDGKTSLEKWLPFAPVASADARIPQGVEWVDALEDPKTKELRADLPQDRIAYVELKRTRTLTVAVDGYAAPVRHYRPLAASKEAASIGWVDVGAFASVNGAKVERLAFSRDGTYLFAGLENFEVARLNLEKAAEDPAFSPPLVGRWCGFASDGTPLVRRLASSDEESATLLLCAWGTGKPVRKLQVPANGRTWHGRCELSPDGTKMAVLQGRTARLVNLAKDDETSTWTWPNAAAGQSIVGAAFSADGHRLAVGYAEDQIAGAVVVWDLRTKKQIGEFRNRQTGLPFLAFSPDGTEIAATGKHPGNVWVFDLSEKGRDRVLHNATPSPFHSLAWSPDGSTIAADVIGPRVRPDAAGVVLWEAKGGKLQGILPGLEEWANAVAFSRDGRHMAAADARGTIRLWRREK